MKKLLTIFCLIALAISNDAPTITAATEGECEPNGNGSIQLKLTQKGTTPIPSKFNVILSLDEVNIQAICTYGTYNSNQIIKNSGLDSEILETQKQSHGKEIIFSQQEKTTLDEGKNESNKEGTDTHFVADESNKEGTNTHFVADETQKEGTNTHSVADETQKEGTNTHSVSDETQKEETGSYTGNVVTNEGNSEIPQSSISTEGRRLQEDEAFLSRCTFVAPKKPGNYKLTLENGSEFKIDGEISVNLTPCVNAIERLNIALSFRQVNQFNIQQNQFMFFGLTSKSIESGYWFIFYIYLMKGAEKKSEPLEANCTIVNPVIVGTSGIMPAAFECKFEPIEQIDYESIEIESSDYVAGLPANKTLLNPHLVDEAIGQGLLPNITEGTEAVKIVEEPKVNFDSIDTGKFELIINSLNIGENMKGEQISLSLAYPSWIVIIFTIRDVADSKVTIQGEIKGQIENQPLIFEQTLINVNGSELFVLPAFKTEEISTNGIPSEEVESPDTSEGKEELFDSSEGKEGERSDITDGKEGKEESSDTSEGKVGERSDITHETDEEEESIDTSEGKEGESSDINDTKEGETSNEIRDEKIILFRQVNTFDLENHKFMFFGLTSQTLLLGFYFEFDIYFINGELKLPTKGKAKCDIGSIIKEITSPIMPVYFNCYFDKPTDSDITSIEIISSENILGIPEDKELLNPKLVDENKDIKKIDEDSPAPILVEKPNIDTSLIQQGILMLTFNFEGTMDNFEGKEFTITLENEIILIFIIEKIEGTQMIIKCKIDGKVENESLKIEERLALVNGTELFVLPEFETGVISTEGFKPSSDEIVVESSDTTNGKEDESSDTTSGETSEKESTDKKLPSEVPPTIPTPGNESEPITIDEAEEISKIFISFRQLNGFKFNEGKISFNFFALTTQSLTIDVKIILFVNLVGKNGMDENATDITCSLTSPVAIDNEGESKQAIFICERSGLDINGEYSSLRLNSSEDIAGIPEDDEILLNPALTDEAIKNKEMKDAKNSKVPPTFILNTIETQNCANDGKFIIKGNISDNSEIPSTKFTLPLTYPEGTSITCTFDNNSLECVADSKINDIVIEQAIVTNGLDEIFIIKNITFKGMNCGNGLLKKAEDKINVGISFRQVSHIRKVNNGFTFFFAAFVNSPIQANYQIIMNTIIMVGEEKVDKEATCILKESIQNSGDQGDFECTVTLSKGEDVPLENLTISNNNDNIGGCADLSKEESSPKATDNAILEASTAGSDLAIVIDYYLAENKKRKPPSFTLTGFKNLDKCHTKGKFKIQGKFSEKIEEEMTFDLPFSFPSSKVKCTVESANKDEDVEFTCKMQKYKRFFTFDKFVLEPKIIKKKRMEMLYIVKTNKQLEKEYICENFNEIKKIRAKARKHAHFSFLQIGRPINPANLFFMALTKKSAEIKFEKLIKFSVTIMYSRSRRLRSLDSLILDEKDIGLNCAMSEDLCTEKSCSLDCGSDDFKGTPAKLEFNDDSIAGAPDEVPVEQNPKPDYSKIQELKAFDGLPVIEITDVTSNNCSLNGSYKITATTDHKLNFTEKDNITIPFSYPDSSGLCIIKIKDSKNLEINCHNKEEFSATEIIIPSQTIYDKDGTTPLLKTEKDYTGGSLSCAISDLSIPVLPSNGTSGTSGKGFYRKNSKEKGLTGGAIAGIIIGCLVVVGIVAALIFCMKKGTFSKSKLTTSHGPYESNANIELSTNKKLSPIAI